MTWAELIRVLRQHRLTQVELADLMATSREHLNRLLGALERDGAVEWRDGWLTIPAGRHDGRRGEALVRRPLGVTKVTQSV